MDIEASNLDADFGIILSYCIKDSKSNKIFEALITEEDLRKDLDKRIVRQLIKDMLQFDKVVTWYGNKFDLPYIRTRALERGLSFPEYGSIKHHDIYLIARYKLKLHSNRLENVCRVILGKTLKTHIESKYWIGALRGNKKSLDYILDHNRRDVLDLEKIYKKLINFVPIKNTSI